MSRRRIARVVLALTVLGALVPLLARASHGDVPDPDDTRGLLDVRLVKTFGADEPGWRIITFSDWTARRVWDAGYFVVHLDTFGDPAYDYYALVSSYGPAMQARLWRAREQGDREIGELQVWRKDRSSVSVRVPLHRLRIGETRATYRWYAQTLWTSDACPRTCFDIVPAEDGVIEPIPGATPSPTGTILPTQIPTP